MTYTISGGRGSRNAAMSLTAQTAQEADAKAQGLQSNGLNVSVTGPDGKTMTMEQLSKQADAEGDLMARNAPPT
jgi:hypothetical protein